jgi:hypothetical protein
LTALPDTENRHAIDGAVRIIFGRTAHGIRSSNNKCDISV